MQFLFSTLALIALLFLTPDLRAQFPLFFNSRPGLTEQATTPEKSEIIIETGFLFQRDDFNKKSIFKVVDIYNVLPTLVRYAIFDGTEVRLGGNYSFYGVDGGTYADGTIRDAGYRISDDRYTTFTLGVKQEIISHEDYVLFSGGLNYYNYTSHYTNGKEFRNNAFNIYLTLDYQIENFIVTINPSLAFHTEHSGMYYASNDLNEYNIKALAGYNITEDLSAMIEAAYYNRTSKHYDDKELFINTGLQYYFLENIGMNLLAGYGISNNSIIDYILLINLGIQIKI